MRHPGLAVKFGLALFAIVAGALGIVYLAVVPRLETRLVNAKIDDLKSARSLVANSFQRADPVTEYDAVARAFQSSLGARVVVLERLHGNILRDVGDSNPLGTGSIQSDAVAREALESGRLATGRVTRDGEERAEVAFPIRQGRVVLLSAPLEDVLGNVSLVRRTLIFAGIAALGASLLVGAFAAWHFTRRIRNLEEAAERIAAGDFEQPVVDPVDDEVGELAQAFETMRLRLAQLDHARREFIANASHELRTPLFSLGGFLELMANEELDENERREFVEEMAGQVGRLTKLATDLLDLSRLDAGQLAVGKAEVDLAGIARTVGEEFRALADASGHELAIKATAPVVALGDEQRILQVARILVENALKHTPSGTSVVVTGGRIDGEASLSVGDDGPGVPARDQEHLFERFYRADGGKASGSGLGLAIAWELALRMEGAIELRSRPGETVFTLILPPAEVAEPADFTGKETVGAPG